MFSFHLFIYVFILDIVIPGTNSSTDVQARITAGESIHVIRGTKGSRALSFIGNLSFYLSVLIMSSSSVSGTYIRTSDGRIFAIRAANKAKLGEEGTAAPPKGNMMHLLSYAESVCLYRSQDSVMLLKCILGNLLVIKLHSPSIQPDLLLL